MTRRVRRRMLGECVAPRPHGKEQMYVAWRDLRAARGRFGLIGAVVVLVTVLVGLVSGLAAGLARESTSAIADLPADRIVVAAPEPGEKASLMTSELTSAALDGWRAAPEVAEATPVTVASVRASGERRATVTVMGAPGGSRLAPDVASGRAVLSTGAADALGLTAGDAVRLGAAELTVAAVRGDASLSHVPVVWTVTDDVPSQGRSGDVAATFLAVTLADGHDVDTAALDAALGTSTTTVKGSLGTIGAFTSENGSLQMMQAFLLVISALVVGSFFTVWTVQRAGDVAVLRALGASTRLLLRDALGQALVVLLAGTGVGMVVVVGAGLGVRQVVPFVLSPATVLVPFAALVILGLAGAALAVRRVTSVDPLTALGSVR